MSATLLDPWFQVLVVLLLVGLAAVVTGFLNAVGSDLWAWVKRVLGRRL